MERYSANKGWHRYINPPADLLKIFRLIFAITFNENQAQFLFSLLV